VQFNFPAVTNAAKYEIEYTVTYGSSVIGTGTLQTTTTPYAGYVGMYSTTQYPSLYVKFKLRVQFTDNTWSSWVASNSQFLY
jgi:hypothetical protein